MNNYRIKMEQLKKQLVFQLEFICKVISSFKYRYNKKARAWIWKIKALATSRRTFRK